LRDFRKSQNILYHKKRTLSSIFEKNLDKNRKICYTLLCEYNKA